MLIVVKKNSLTPYEDVNNERLVANNYRDLVLEHYYKYKNKILYPVLFHFKNRYSKEEVTGVLWNGNIKYFGKKMNADSISKARDYIKNTLFADNYHTLDYEVINRTNFRQYQYQY